MAQIPLYEQHTAPTQGPSAPAPDLSAPFQALQQFGGVAADVGFQFADRMNKEEGEAQTAQYMADRKLRQNAMESQISKMTDPDEIEEFYSQWEEEEQSIFSDAKLNRSARKRIENNYEDFYATNRMGAKGYISDARIEGFDRGYIDAQNMALNNETDETLINPNTGAAYTPSELYEYATMKRVDLGTVKYEEAVGDIRDFGQNLAYKRVVTAADNNPDEAQGILNESNLTDERLILASDAIRDSRERQEKGIKTLQAQSANDVNRAVKDQTLSRTELDRISKETQFVMGKEVPVLEPGTASTYKQMLDASETDDLQKAEERLKKFRGYLDDVTNVGRYDTGMKETEKMYGQIAKLGTAGASRVTMEGLLNTANIATEDYAKDRGWSAESADMMRDIADAYTTLYVEGDYKRKNVDPVMSIINKTNGFIKFIEEHKGKPSPEALKEWRKENMGELDVDMALNKFRDTYRVGEKKRVDEGIRVYKGDGVFEMEVDD